MEFNLNDFIMGAFVGLFFIGTGIAWFSYFHVEEGHLAVLNEFGSVVYDSQNESSTIDFLENQNLKLFKPGGHWKRPWAKVLSFSTMERVIDLSSEDGGKYTMASDGTVLRLDSKIRFFPKPTEYYSYLFELKNPMDHLREMFTCTLRNEIANFCGQSLEEQDALGSYAVIRRERKRLNQQVELICKDQLSTSYGIQFQGVDLTEIIPPHELEDALNGIQHAKSNSEIIFAKAEGESRKKIVAAEHGVEIAKLKAEAIALQLVTKSKMIKQLCSDGNINNFLSHRKTELVGDSKMQFMQREI